MQYKRRMHGSASGSGTRLGEANVHLWTQVFDDDGSYALNKMTGEVNWMREESGSHIMDLWVDSE